MKAQSYGPIAQGVKCGRNAPHQCLHVGLAGISLKVGSALALLDLASHQGLHDRLEDLAGDNVEDLWLHALDNSRHHCFYDRKVGRTRNLKRLHSVADSRSDRERRLFSGDGSGRGFRR